MGQVYVAEQKSLARKVALKILRPDVANNINARERFEVEARAVASATHANIVQVYAFGEWNGLLYMALEYVEGRNLRDFMTRKGPPDLLLALSILRQVAAALQRASELGITHRDIKPENILLTKKGEAKVADFGLSRDDQQPLNLTQSGVTMGTPLYMSPEQVEGGTIDPRSDIYSLGVTAYPMLGGEPPFRGSTAFEVALAHVRKDPPPLQEVRPDLPEDLCAMVHRMMEKNPDDRYQTAREILSELSKIRGKASGSTQAIPIDETQPRRKKKKPAGKKAKSEAKRKTAPQRSQVKPRSRKWMVVGSLILALGVGAAIAFVVNRNKKEKGPWTKGQNRLLPEEKLQQKRKMAEEYLDGSDNFKIDSVGPRLCVQVGLEYLEQNRLPEAESWFTRVSQAGMDKPLSIGPRQYQTLGLLGLGVVEAMRDNPQKSKEMFIKAGAKNRPRGPGPRSSMMAIRRLLMTHSSLKKWVSNAMRRNKMNDPTFALPRGISSLLGNRDM